MRQRRNSARHQVYVARVGYFLSGFAVACWSPLIPIIKAELQLSTEQISVLVLAFGLGSVSGMFLAGLMIQYIGFKTTYATLTTSLALSICLLASMPSYLIVLLALIVFGISVGGLEVAINVFGAYIEKKYRLLLLSVLFAYYSLGEVVGAVMMLFLLTIALSPAISILSMITLIYVACVYYVPTIIDIKSENKQENRTFVKPVQPVISLALIVTFTYMVGGAILDWSGLYLTEEVDVPLNYAALGYCLVSICMLTCRIYSTPILRKIGPFRFSFYGALVMVVGLGSLALTNNIFIAICCFVAIGCGMSNISPLSTSAAGQQKNMPLIPAISFVSICSYTGLMLGPACLGLIASTVGLKGIFVFLACLTLASSGLIYLTRRDFAVISVHQNQSPSNNTAPAPAATAATVNAAQH